MRNIVKNLATLALFLAPSLVKADSVILPPSDTNAGTPIALVMVHGMQCKPEAYKKMLQEFQDVASKEGLKAWVGAPEFAFDVPEPVLIGSYVKDILKEMKEKHGYPGDQIYIAAHSLGGVMSQIYTKGKNDWIKGQILMGSVLLRDKRKINEDGETQFDYDVPTLTLNGELDGLLRISRGAESYYHQVLNIKEDQKDKYPIMALEGVSHSSFMDSTMLPSAVKSSDIKPEIDEATGYNQIGNAMVNFIQGIEGKPYSDNAVVEQIKKYTNEFMAPLIEGMKLEGSYAMKDACYDSKLVNRDSPECLQGSAWSDTA